MNSTGSRANAISAAVFFCFVLLMFASCGGKDEGLSNREGLSSRDMLMGSWEREGGSPGTNITTYYKDGKFGVVWSTGRWGIDPGDLEFSGTWSFDDNKITYTVDEVYSEHEDLAGKVFVDEVAIDSVNRLTLSEASGEESTWTRE